MSLGSKTCQASFRTSVEDRQMEEATLIVQIKVSAEVGTLLQQQFHQKWIGTDWP